ncbi:MAG: 50S ribosomal protein L29 [Deltaproteobacteria bacterium CG2_30_63_29]|nr:MAG: 50S ribosomal protein L29 [Deltaproteobacteria bacterium CG2_30_63_29]PJB35142.1 MAG: 50S ribosomal protein L29 [Deltaproteobacteria bacterium CG_4_9_14_3_um_filter_63_12]
MNAAELREKNSTELREILGEVQQERFGLRIQHCTGQLEKVTRLKETRRIVARIMTILRERELAAK